MYILVVSVHSMRITGAGIVTVRATRTPVKFCHPAATVKDWRMLSTFTSYVEPVAFTATVAAPVRHLRDTSASTATVQARRSPRPLYIKPDEYPIRSLSLSKMFSSALTYLTSLVRSQCVICGSPQAQILHPPLHTVGEGVAVGVLSQ